MISFKILKPNFGYDLLSANPVLYGQVVQKPILPSELKYPPQHEI